MATSNLPIHIHDKSRATEATLSTVVVGENFLDGVQAISCVSETLDCRDLPTVTIVHVRQTLFKPKYELYFVCKKLGTNIKVYS